MMKNSMALPFVFAIIWSAIPLCLSEASKQISHLDGADIVISGTASVIQAKIAAVATGVNFTSSDKYEFVATGSPCSAGVSAGTAVSVSSYSWLARESSRDWNMVTSSIDGSKWLAGVYTGSLWVSTDFGATWTEDTSIVANKDWMAVTASSDFTKLAAVALTDNIWISNDSGSTWSSVASVQDWSSITSSSDGSQLAAVVSGGNIWLSIDSGSSWTEDASIGSTQSWRSITSSSDGTKLAAVVSGGNIWLSTDSGASWSEDSSVGSTKSWMSITSSSDGSKLAAVVSGGNIWLSTDSGASWSEDSSVGSTKSWISITSSSDGSKLAAVVSGGNIWLSADSGTLWAEETQVSTQSWVSVAYSGDGSSLIGAAIAAPLYVYTPDSIEVSMALLTAGGSYDLCYNSGGTTSLVAQTTAQPWVIVTGSSTTISQLEGSSTVISSNSTYLRKQSLSVAGDGTSSSDKYEFVVSGAGCTTGISAGTVVDSTFGSIGTSNTFYDMASSDDGTKLAGVVFHGNIWTSTDSGATWTEDTSIGSTQQWRCITSSSDGTKLAAAVIYGNIWTSDDSGATWTEDTSIGTTQAWIDITSSSDGSILVAVISANFFDAAVDIYRSTDSGATWSTTGVTSWWACVTSSSDGSVIAAGASAGSVGDQLQVSTDSGATWTEIGPTEAWIDIAASADGTHIIAGGYQTYLLISSDSGSSWTEVQVSGARQHWRGLDCSDDFTQLFAVTFDGGVWKSVDSGSTWAQASAPVVAYTGILSSSDGSKLIAYDTTGGTYANNGVAVSLANVNGGTDYDLCYNLNGNTGLVLQTTAQPWISVIVISILASESTLTETVGVSVNDWSVSLNSQPSTNVTVTCISDDSGIVAVPSPSANELTFGTSNFNIPQSIQLDVVGIGSVNISCTSANLVSVAVSVTAAVSGITCSASALSETVGVTVSDWTIALTSSPSVDVTVTCASDSGSVNIASDTLTFTPTNWATGQAMVLNMQSATTSDATVTCTANNVGGYNLEETTATVSVNDPAVLVSESSLTETTGVTVSDWTIALTSSPSVDVTVTCVSDSGSVNIASDTLTFTPTNWATGQAMPLQIASSGSATVTCTAGNTGGYTGSETAAVSISAADAGVVASADSAVLPIGNSSLLNIRLGSSPSSDVVVLCESDSSALLVQNSLTFSPVDWFINQSISLQIRSLGSFMVNCTSDDNGGYNHEHTTMFISVPSTVSLGFRLAPSFVITFLIALSTVLISS